MSEQEKKSGSKVLVVDQAPPYRPPEPEESGPGARGARARAPALSSPLSKNKIEKDTSEIAKKPESPEETIAMASLEPELTKHPDTASPTSHSTKPAAPIPPHVTSTTAIPSPPLPAKPDEQISADINIESDVAELRTVMDTEPRHSKWSDDEEAGGLPRSDSRASRVSRAVRQLFCCGMPYEAPSEDNISSRGFAL